MCLLHYILPFYIKVRMTNGKEDKMRWREKLSIYSDERLKSISHAKHDRSVLWFHAVSIGEFNAIKPLLKLLEHPSRLLLVTTVTRGGALTCTTYQEQCNNLIHSFAPLDTPQIIARFIKIWEPKMLILVESEIWPNMINTVSKTCPVAIINGNMSQKSFVKWNKFAFLIKEILSKCTFITTSTEGSMRYYSSFYSKNIYCTGNLKYDATPLAADMDVVNKLRASIGSRHVMVCASTHYGEEEMLLHTCKRIAEKLPHFLMVIIPRHIDRGQDIATICTEYGISSTLRSRETTHNSIPKHTQVYIADTIGELGTFFRLGNIVFIGGSLVNIGGHNLVEPAMLKCAIIIGPYYQSCIEMVNGLSEKKAILIAYDSADLAVKFLELYDDMDEINTITSNASAFINENKGAIDRTLGLMSKYIV